MVQIITNFIKKHLDTFFNFRNEKISKILEKIYENILINLKKKSDNFINEKNEFLSLLFEEKNPQKTLFLIKNKFLDKLNFFEQILSILPILCEKNPIKNSKILFFIQNILEKNCDNIEENNSKFIKQFIIICLIFCGILFFNYWDFFTTHEEKHNFFGIILFLRKNLKKMKKISEKKKKSSFR